MFSLPAPAQVTRLQVSNGGSTDSLQVQWQQTSGELDFYRILLVHDSIIIKNQSVEANTTGVGFHALIPGALYRVVVTTITAAHSSRQTVAEGRTGKRRLRGVAVALICGIMFQSSVAFTVINQPVSQSFPKCCKKGQLNC